MINQETLKEFDKLYNDTYQDIVKYVVCKCHNIDDVKDITQNIYLAILKKTNLKDINKAYLLGIAKNKINEYYRFKYKQKIISLFSEKEKDIPLENIPSDFVLQDYIIKEQDLKTIWQFLKKKKVIIPKIFYLYYYSDLNLKQISELLNISESNVKNYLYRTLKELEKYLKERSDTYEQ